MQKLITFLYSFKQTFTSPTYYADIIQARFSFSLKFYFTYFLLYTLVATTIVSLRIFLPFGSFLETVPGNINRMYPSELEITIEDGVLSTNVVEPYFIPMTVFNPLIESFDEHVLGETAGPQNVVVIDTGAYLEAYEGYDTFALITDTDIIYTNDDGNREVVSLKDIDSLTVNKSAVSKILTVVEPYMQTIVPILIVFFFVFMSIVFPAFGLLYILWIGLLVFVSAKLWNVPVGYSKSYQMGLHLVVIPTTIFGLLGLFDITYTFPFRDTVIYLILATFIFRSIQKATKKK
jgi:hypothetical protein